MSRLSFVNKVVAGLIGTIALVGVCATVSSASPSNSPQASSSPAADALPALLGTEQPAVAVEAASLSTRACWYGVSGLVKLYVYLPVAPGQAVAVSASELNSSTNTEFIGLATITVHNVTVTSGLVNTLVNVAWGSPINVCLHYLA